MMPSASTGTAKGVLELALAPRHSVDAEQPSISHNDASNTTEQA